MDLAARPGQRLGEDSADRTVVICHKNGAVHVFVLLSYFCSRGTRERDSLKVVLPGSERTEIQPL